MDGGGASVACGSSLSCVDVTPGVWASSDSSTCARCNTTVSLQTCGGRCWAAHDSCAIKLKHCTNLHTPCLADHLCSYNCSNDQKNTSNTLYTQQKLEVLEGRCPAEFSSNPNQTHLEQLIKLLLGTLETPGRCVEASWS